MAASSFLRGIEIVHDQQRLAAFFLEGLCAGSCCRLSPDTAAFGESYPRRTRSLDPALPPSVCEFRNHKGEVLYADTLTTTRALEARRP
jgi:hypothetical protein